jgi:glycosyltransferase involved in cell wall biosynthesis
MSISSNTKKININCPINGTGYGITSLNIVKALQQQDLDLYLFPIGSKIEVNSEEDSTIIKSLIEKADSFPHNAPCIKIWHQYDLASHPGKGHYYGFPFFEIDKILPKEVHHLNYCDYIFVASKWGKEILLNNGITKPIYVAPLGVDTNIFSPPNKIRLENDNYIFFHIGKWEHRKAQDFLLKAFDSAFTEKDNVELRLLPFNPFLSEKENEYWFRLVDNCKLKDKIKIFGRLPTQYHLAQFIDIADCGVFPSRAEGWNNEILETMAMNKPVIATKYSAHTEYCDDDNSYLIDVDTTEPANDNKWFHGQGNWAKLSSNELDQTVYYMKYVYHNGINTNANGVLTANKYSWSRNANIIHQTLLKNNSYYAHTRKKAKRK